MKELSIEEKAKAYDEALIRGSRLWESDMITRENYEYIFSEVVESEDERIRKEILSLIRYTKGRRIGYEPRIHQDKMIAWLEKQGQTFTKKDVDDAYLKGVCDTKHELEKQCEQNHVWSDEDEINLEKAIWYVENPAPMVVKDSMLVEWLKSLRPQNTWKPSDEQMHYLSWIANVKLGESVVEQEVSKHLNELLEDLKKLKG